LNGYLRVKWLIKSTTWSFWLGSDNKWGGGRGRNYQKRNQWFCINIMRQHTLPSPWSNILPIIAFQCSNIPLMTAFNLLWLLPIAQSEKYIERNMFSACQWGEIENGGSAEQGGTVLNKGKFICSDV
jgi:hypothetical protein